MRDRDGSLLFTARACYAFRVQPGRPDDSQAVRVWRSDDSGRSWRLAMRAADARPPSPVVRNVTAGGQPYLALNALCWTGEPPAHIGAEREFLEVRGIDLGKRDRVGNMVVRDGPADFGAPPTTCRSDEGRSTTTLRDVGSGRGGVRLSSPRGQWAYFPR